MQGDMEENQQNLPEDKCLPSTMLEDHTLDLMVRPYNKKIMGRFGQTDLQDKNHRAEVQDHWSCVADPINKTSEELFGLKARWWLRTEEKTIQDLEEDCKERPGGKQQNKLRIVLDGDCLSPNVPQRMRGTN